MSLRETTFIFSLFHFALLTQLCTTTLYNMMPYIQHNSLEIIGNLVLHGAGLVLLIIDLTMNRMEFMRKVPLQMLIFAIGYMLVMVAWSCSFYDLYEGVKWCTSELPKLFITGLLIYALFLCLWVALGFLNLAKFKYWAEENIMADFENFVGELIGLPELPR